MTTLYTIGYEGTGIDRFVARLHEAGVKVLADVRALPLSRKKGFSKNVLRSRLEKEGIAYLHFKALGTPKPGREAARAGRYEEFSDLYHSHLKSVEAQVELESLGLRASEAPTCLLCFERDPALCHRSIIAARLRRRGLEVVDLYPQAEVRA